MIVTGESSGELYGALLAAEVKKFHPDVRIIGVGGSKMKEAGVEVFAGIAGAFGLAEALSSYKAVKQTLDLTIDMLYKEKPDVVVLIDYPDFNFRVGMAAKKAGIKVLYYVSPQVWAWRPGRVKTMAGFVDRMAVILPFEEAIYKNAGIPCEFVGHPVMREIEESKLDKSAAKKSLGLDADKPYISVLPGSRHSELTRLLPVLTEFVRLFKREFPAYGIVVPMAPNIDESKYKEHFDALKSEGATLVNGNAISCFVASEAAVVASGTAALQGVLCLTPLVVVYRISLLTYVLAKLIIKVKYANIANIMLNRMAVPELLQAKATPGNILNHVSLLLNDKSARARLIDDMKTVREKFEGRSPSARAAMMVDELAGWAGQVALK